MRLKGCENLPQIFSHRTLIFRHVGMNLKLGDLNIYLPKFKKNGKFIFEKDNIFAEVEI